MTVRILGVAGALLMAFGCSSPAAVGTVTAGMTGKPVEGLRVVARAVGTASLNCQTAEGITDAGGRFQIDGLCGDVTYTLEDADRALWFADAPTVEGGVEASVALTAWWGPDGAGVHRWSPDGTALVRNSADVVTEEVGGTSVRYVKDATVAQRIEAGQYLVMTGASDRLELLPLVLSESRGVKYIGAQVEGDEVTPRALQLDERRVRRAASGTRKAKYVAHDAVPAGEYAVVGGTGPRVRVVAFGPEPAAAAPAEATAAAEDASE